MSRSHLSIILISMLAAPFALAHDPAGTPDRFCTGPTQVHDYGAGPGNLITNHQDGNLQECGTTQELNVRQLCVDVKSETGEPLVCVPLCDLNPALESVCHLDRGADWDHELEYANGGAVLAAQDPAATHCWDIPAHHDLNPVVYADDLVLGSAVLLTVVSDWARADDPTQPECGDNLTEVCDPADPAEVPNVTCNMLDQAARGTGAGVVAGFGPGQDGTYHIFVGPGTGGHVWTGSPGPTGAPEVGTCAYYAPKESDGWYEHGVRASLRDGDGDGAPDVSVHGDPTTYPEGILAFAREVTTTADPDVNGSVDVAVSDGEFDREVSVAAARGKPGPDPGCDWMKK